MYGLRFIFKQLIEYVIFVYDTCCMMIVLWFDLRCVLISVTEYFDMVVLIEPPGFIKNSYHFCMNGEMVKKNLNKFMVLSLWEIKNEANLIHHYHLC